MKTISLQALLLQEVLFQFVSFLCPQSTHPSSQLTEKRPSRGSGFPPRWGSLLETQQNLLETAPHIGPHAAPRQTRGPGEVRTERGVGILLPLGPRGLSETAWRRRRGTIGTWLGTKIWDQGHRDPRPGPARAPASGKA